MLGAHINLMWAFGCTIKLKNMTDLESDYPYVRLPKRIDRLLFTLAEELRNNKCFNALEAVGFETGRSRSHFTFVVLDTIFNESPDELVDQYLDLLEKHTVKLKDTRKTTLAKRALKFYVDLMVVRAERRRV
jgi:hypothetical protein